MKLSAADRERFPKFAYYVRHNMPQVVTVPVIVKAMKDHGSLSKVEVQNAVQWDSGPLIVIKTLSNYMCPTLANYFGCFEPANADQIEIDVDSVRSFEDDAYGNGSGTNALGRKLFIVGVTLLHETCHWGNFHHGVAEATEQGFAFENAVYGKTVPS